MIVAAVYAKCTADFVSGIFDQWGIAEVTLQNGTDFFDKKLLQNEVKTGQL